MFFYLQRSGLMQHFKHYHNSDVHKKELNELLRDYTILLSRKFQQPKPSSMLIALGMDREFITPHIQEQYDYALAQHPELIERIQALKFEHDLLK